jgi:hypothetical protein
MLREVVRLIFRIDRVTPSKLSKISSINRWYRDHHKVISLLKKCNKLLLVSVQEVTQVQDQVSFIQTNYKVNSSSQNSSYPKAILKLYSTETT